MTFEISPGVTVAPVRLPGGTVAYCYVCSKCGLPLNIVNGEYWFACDCHESKEWTAEQILRREG